ncbi:MAG TPA: flagellar hook-basal body complex protein [Clostridiales bacterium]|nr:flagellar hook-basal body complex protein [Clostridiales bacterium]
MIRSMYSGVSGMRSNQIKMDVIGNNIANVSTTAFKSNRVRFQDAFYQTRAFAQAPTANGRGGINPQQVGNGVTVAAIDTMFADGNLQPTGRDLDLGIEGEGFFVVSMDTAGQIKRYTRDGAFYKDFNGSLVNAEGYYILGVSNFDVNGVPNQTLPDAIQSDGSNLEILSIPDKINDGGVDYHLEAFYIDGTGLITAIYENGEVYYPGRVALAKFPNVGGLEKLGGNTYGTTRNSGAAEYGSPSEDGLGILRQGNLEMSNVDLANEFTEMIITSRAFQANSRIITTSDEMLQELINLKR